MPFQIGKPVVQGVGADISGCWRGRPSNRFDRNGPGDEIGDACDDGGAKRLENAFHAVGVTRQMAEANRRFSVEKSVEDFWRQFTKEQPNR